MVYRSVQEGLSQHGSALQSLLDHRSLGCLHSPGMPSGSIPLSFSSFGALKMLISSAVSEMC